MKLKKKNLIKEIELDFRGVFKNRTYKFNFKNKDSKADIYISLKTGTVFNSPSSNSSQSLDLWSKKIYSKKSYFLLLMLANGILL